MLLSSWLSLSRFLSWESSSIFEVQTFGNSMPGYVCNFDSSSGIVHVIIHLLHTIELQIQQAYDDLLGAALRQPVFGETNNINLFIYFVLTTMQW